MTQPVADLYVRLSAQTSPLLASFSEATAAGERFTAQFTAMMGEIEAAFTRATAGTGEISAAAERMATQVTAAETGLAESNARLAASVGQPTEAFTAMSAKIKADLDEVVAAEARATEANKALGAAMTATATRSTVVADAAGAAGAAMGTAAERGTALTGALGATNSTLDKIAASLGVSRGTLLGVGVAVAGVGYESIKMAANYETATNKLLTSGGEIQANIAQVRQGMLDMAGQVGVSAQELAKHMYTVESAGYHGAAGLGVLKAAEQGAKAEGADATTVADALSSALRDYYPNASSAADVTRAATDVMSRFIGATSAGKLTFDQLAGSLHSVLPLASAMHVPLNDILGDLASMTVHGMSADQATQNLSHALQHLQTVTAPQQKEFALLGLSVRQVAHDLSDKGLAGTVQEISRAITERMGKGTTDLVLNLNQALVKLPPPVQDLGRQLLAGTITQGEFTKAARGLNVEAAGQAMQFATLAKSTHGIGSETKSASEIYQTYSAALKAAMGDQTGLNVALLLTGDNANYTNSAIKQVAGSTADAAGNVRGWSEIQGTFNQKMSEFKASLGALAISIGEQLLPTATAFISKLSELAGWLTRHKEVATVLAYTITAVLGVAIAGLTLKMLDLITRPIRALPGALMDFGAWVGRMTGRYGDLTVSAEASALKRETAETEAATAADVAATRTQEAATRMQVAYGEMATASELARDRIVAADAEAAIAAEGEAAAGAAGGGLLKGGLGLLGPIGAVVGGTLAVNDLTGGNLSKYVNKFTGGDAALSHSPRLLGGAPPAPAAPPPPPDYSKMFKAPPPAAGDKNDIRNLPQTVAGATAAAAGAVRPVPGLGKATALPPATPNDIRGLTGIVGGAMTNTGKTVDAQSPSLSQKMRNAWNAFLNFGPEKLGYALGSAAGDIATFAMKIAVPPPGFFQAGKNWGNKIGDGIKAVFVPSNDFFQSGKSVGDTIVHGLQTALSPPQSFFDTGRRLGGNILNAVKTALNPGDSFFRTGRSIGQGFWNGLNDFWRTIDAKVGGLLDGFVRGFKSHFRMSSPSQVMHDIGSDVMQGFGNGAIDKWNRLANDIGKIPGYIGTIFSGAANWLVGAGKDMIVGLWNGFASWTGEMWNRILGWLNNIWGGIKHFFGISSPSTQMAWIGEQLAQGLATGIAANADKSAVSMGNLAKKVISTAADTVTAQMPALQTHMDAIVTGLRPPPGVVTAATSVGAQIAQGLAAGVDGHSALAVSAVNNMIGGVRAALGAVAPAQLPAGSLLTPQVSALAAPTGPLTALAGLTTNAPGVAVLNTIQRTAPAPTVNVGALTAAAPTAGATTVVHNHYTIQGSIWSERELFRVVQTQAQQHGIRNTSAGINYGFGLSH